MEAVVQLMKSASFRKMRSLVLATHKENKSTTERAEWTIEDTINNLLNKGMSAVEKEGRIRNHLENLFDDTETDSH